MNDERPSTSGTRSPVEGDLHAAITFLTFTGIWFANVGAKIQRIVHRLSKSSSTFDPTRPNMPLTAAISHSFARTRNKFSRVFLMSLQLRVEVFPTVSAAEQMTCLWQLLASLLCLFCVVEWWVFCLLHFSCSILFCRVCYVLEMKGCRSVAVLCQFLDVWYQLCFRDPRALRSCASGLFWSATYLVNFFEYKWTNTSDSISVCVYILCDGRMW